jgi:DNA-binding MarR family transcriptional regulator
VTIEQATTIGTTVVVVSVWGDVDRLATLSRRHFDGVFAAHGLRGYEYEVMAALRESARTPTELSRALLVSPGAMTERIDRLVDQGWAERHPFPEDGRRVSIALTERGAVLVDRTRRDLCKAHRQLLAVLTPTEINALEKLAGKLLGHLEP